VDVDEEHRAAEHGYAVGDPVVDAPPPLALVLDHGWVQRLGHDHVHLHRLSSIVLGPLRLLRPGGYGIVAESTHDDECVDSAADHVTLG
jgi:hypothetical protein